MGLYIHGVTEDLARGLLEPGDVPILIELLQEPSFPRRDNIVAFLAMLDDGSATKDLLAFMVDPPADVDVPEELRAHLGAPHALGYFAKRGDPRALEALLELTRHGGEGGAYLGGARRCSHTGLVDDVLESALRGLAISGKPVARQRLQAIARGTVAPRNRGRDLSRAASREMDLFDATGVPRRARGAGVASRSPADPREAATLDRLGTLDGPGTYDAAVATAPPLAESYVPQPDLDRLFWPGIRPDFTYATGITYANAIAVPDKMTDARLDQILRLGTELLGREDYPGDVACCVTMERSGSAWAFSGYDVINSDGDGITDLTYQILPHVRVKVINAINWCGGPIMNVLACGSVGTPGIIVVRVSDAFYEAFMWTHEYGHNTGLGHSFEDIKNLMYGGYGYNVAGAGPGLSQSDCDFFKAPTCNCNSSIWPRSRADILPVAIGICADGDGDKVHDLADNCPFEGNFTQEDAEFDGQGDLCDADDDNDAIGDQSDCRPFDLNVWALPGEATGLMLTQGPSTTLAWNAPAIPGGTPSSPRYDVLRSGGAQGFSSSPVCLRSDAGPDTTATASILPATLWHGDGGGFRFRYGASVSTAGNINNDAYDDLVVGSPGFSDGSEQKGRVEVRLGSAGGPGFSWTYQPDFVYTALGTSVSGGGDFDNDGFDDIIVGAPTYDDGILVIGGAAFAFYGSSSGLPSSPDWSASGDAGGMFFGGAVAVAGDVDNDSYDDAIVGAPSHTVGFASEGGAFLYRGSATGLSATPTSWVPVGGATGAQFGASVAAAGDVNNDGFADVIVGAPNAASGQAAEGLAYVFLGSAEGLGASPQVLQVDQISAAFGCSVASAGDVNDDGYDDVIVGAKEYDVDQTNEGAAFVFFGSPGGIDPTVGTPLHGDRANADFGVSVSSARNFSDDEYDDLIVGAGTTNNGLTKAGRVYIYLGSEQGPMLFQTIEGDQEDGQMGSAVAGTGDTDGDGFSEVAAGAPNHDSRTANVGRLIVYSGVPGPDPPPGGIFYFLVRAENNCGAGPAGFDSSGSIISASGCSAF